MEHQCQCASAQVGQKVQDFTFETYNPTEGGFEEHSFKEFFNQKKWVVLVFYPADFTFVCPTELADLAEQHEELKKLNVEVLSVSTDTKFSHLAWRTSERLLENVQFQMVADPTAALSQYFGVYDNEGGTAYRGTFILSPEGVLVGTEINFYNVGRNASELLRKMQANNHILKNPAEVCPARWEEGQQTLTPSKDMVGNVYDAIKK